MALVCGTFDGYEGERYHKWGTFDANINDDTNSKLFFRRRCASDNSMKIKRILEEIALVTTFKHTNILPLFGHCTHASDEGESNFYVYSKFAEFGSVNRIISTFYNFGLPEDVIQNILCQIIPAISYLHDQHIIHRAINAQHILLSADGTARIGGFDHSIRVEECNRWIGVEDRVHHFDESLQNVFVWLAPEIMKQDLNGYGVSSDIYSLGITVCEMGNGFSPFCEMEPLQILYEKIRGSTPFLLDATNDAFAQTGVNEDDANGRPYRQHYQKPSFSGEIHDFVAKCLTYGCDERPSCKELLRHKFLEPSSKGQENSLKKYLSDILLSKIVPLSLV